MYLCSGANAAPQTINADNAAVLTAPGFSVNANAGNAITITGDGALSFADNNASSVVTTDVAYGLYMLTFDDAGYLYTRYAKA